MYIFIQHAWACPKYVKVIWAIPKGMKMAIRMKILYVDRLPQKQQIGSYMHMKCPALTIVAYPSLDARAYTKCLKCHTDIFVLKCHAYYFYLF